MGRRHGGVTVGGAVGVALLLAWAGGAAPILPGAAPVRDEVLSLAHLTRLRVSVVPLSDVLRHLDYSRAAAERRIEHALAEADISVAGAADAAAPMLRVEILTEGHRDHADLVACTIHVSVEQAVRIERLDRSLVVPTYAFVHGDLAERDELLEMVDDTLSRIIEAILQRIRIANLSSDGAPVTRP